MRKVQLFVLLLVLCLLVCPIEMYANATDSSNTYKETEGERGSQEQSIDNISVIDYGAVADAQYKDDSTGLWYKDQTKTIRATDNTDAFAKAFNSEHSTIIIPPGNYLLDGECMIKTDNISIICQGNIYVEPKNTKAQYVMNVFCLHNCKNVRIEGVRIYSDRLIDTSIIWQSRDRSIDLSSQRIGFNLCGTENVVIENCYFYGMEYDFKIDIAHGATANNLLEVNKGNVIRNITSYNCSQPIFMTRSSNITVSHYIADVAEGLTKYEHFVYLSRYVKHIYIDNCVIKSTDGSLGPVFNLRVDGSTSGTTYSDCDVHDVRVSDCVFDGIRCIATVTNTNDLYISNCKLVGFVRRDLSSVVFNVIDAGQVIINGGYYEVGASLLSNKETSIKVSIKDAQIITKYKFINNKSKILNNNIVATGCKIDYIL